MLMDDSSLDLELPGFRFHPNEEELLEFYLKNMVLGKKLRYDVIGFVNIYHHDPWDLPGLAKIGEREWYFFVPRDKKHGSGGRPNRTTEHGFWKATGSDRKIFSLSEPKRIIGLKKTLVFYKGRAPRGCKTDWVMNEYRLPTTCPSAKDVVLCKIYRKATSLKELEQRASFQEEKKDEISCTKFDPITPPLMDSNAISSQFYETVAPIEVKHAELKKENNDEEEEEELVPNTNSNTMSDEYEESSSGSSNNSLKGKDKLMGLQLPKLNMDWTQDPFWTQLRSPWLDNFMSPYANVINF